MQGATSLWKRLRPKSFFGFPWALSTSNRWSCNERVRARAGRCASHPLQYLLYRWRKGDTGLSRLCYRAARRAEQFRGDGAIVLDGQLPTVESLAAFDNQLRHNRRVKYNIATIMKSLPATGHPMEMLQTAVASLGMFYPGSEKLTSPNAWQDVEYVHRMSVKIIARMATLVAMWEHIRNGYDPVAPRLDLTYAQNFLYMMTGREPDPVIAKMLDTCLILHSV